jgi:hypothetical protein
MVEAWAFGAGNTSLYAYGFALSYTIDYCRWSITIGKLFGGIGVSFGGAICSSYWGNCSSVFCFKWATSSYSLFVGGVVGFWGNFVWVGI